MNNIPWGQDNRAKMTLGVHPKLFVLATWTQICDLASYMEKQIGQDRDEGRN